LDVTPMTSNVCSIHADGYAAVPGPTVSQRTQTDYSPAQARKEFDRWSRHYDWDLLQPLFFRPSHRMILNTLDPSEKRILDIGCGTGQFAASLRERFPDSQVWGLDLSTCMLRKACSRSTLLDDRLHLVQADSERLPFADNNFDAVTCSHSFHHYPHQASVLREVHRVLRPGGRLLLIDGDRDGLWGRLIFDVIVVLMEGPVLHRTSEDLQALYSAAGFTNVSQQRRGGPLPFLMTVGSAFKQSSRLVARRAA